MVSNNTSPVVLQDMDFRKIFIEESKRHSVTYGAIKALQNYVESSTSKTCQGLMKEIDPACSELMKIAQ